MTNRQTLALVAVVALAAVLLVLRSPVGGDPSPQTPTIAAGGQCLGFAPTGDGLADRALLDRALATWVAGSGVPLHAVCAINAGSVDGETYVTMVTTARFATYVERTGTRQGLLSTTGDLADPGPRFTLPALPVGAGRWQLSRDARSAAVHVGAPGRPQQVARIPDGQAVVPVQDLVDAYSAAYPGVLPHLLLLLQSGPTLYAAVGGSPYAASTDLVFPVALAGGALGRTEYDTLLASPSGVPLLSQAVGFTPVGRQVPQRISRSLLLVGSATAPVGPVLVVRQHPEADPTQPEAVSIVQLSNTGADVQPIGIVPAVSVVPAGGGWSGGVWLRPVAEGDRDPGTFVAVGAPAGVRDPPVTLRITSGGRSVTRAGPVVVLTGADLPGLSSVNHPPVAVTATGLPDEVLPPLTVGP